MNARPTNPFATENGALIFAHRGWRGCYPENTLFAMQKAAELPIDALEIDIHMTQDGVIVVHHDETLNRCTNGYGAISEYRWTELQGLDAGFYWTEDAGNSYPFRGKKLTIPSLEEVYAIFPDLWINIDIKQHDGQIIQPLADLIHRLGVAERTCVGSFDTATVKAFRQAVPDAGKTGSYDEVRQLFILSKLGLERFYSGQADLFQISEFHGRMRIVTPKFVRAAHRCNVAVHVWTVNEIAEMRRLLAMGVDGIITDFPDRAVMLSTGELQFARAVAK